MITLCDLFSCCFTFSTLGNSNIAYSRFFFFCIIATQSYSLNKARVYISSSNINSLYLHTLKRFKVANGIFIVVLFETDVTAWDWHVWKLLKFISYLVYFYTPWKHQKIGIEWFREVILPWRNVFSCFNKAIFLLWPKYHRGTKMAVTNLRILSLQNCICNNFCSNYQHSEF